MNKKLIITVLILIIVGFMYYKLIENQQSLLDSQDRSILVENYQDENYVGFFNTTEKQIYVIQLDDDLQIKGSDTFGEAETTGELLEMIEVDLDYPVQDVLIFDNDKVVDYNIDPEYVKYYQDFAEYHQTVTDMLAGDASLYHPDYNNILVRIAEANKIIDDGVMKKAVVREMIDAKISQEEIDKAFLTVTIPALECEEPEEPEVSVWSPEPVEEESPTCTIIEPYYNEIKKNFNALTDHKLPEYSQLTKEDEKEEE